MKLFLFILIACLTGPAGFPVPAWCEPDRQQARTAMVAHQIRDRGITDARVLAAMEAVPRHWFVPESQRSRAYHDRPLPIGYGQTISQPYIVALMTELLDLNSRSRVLEVGTGSGYQAAVMAEITDHVFTVEIVEPLHVRAAKTLRNQGYETVQGRHSDGYFGWEAHAPFDAVIVTCASEFVPPPLIRQLKPGGKMCIPVGPPFKVQHLVLITKTKAGEIRTRVIAAVRFVPLVRNRD